MLSIILRQADTKLTIPNINIRMKVINKKTLSKVREIIVLAVKITVVLGCLFGLGTMIILMLVGIVKDTLYPNFWKSIMVFVFFVLGVFLKCDIDITEIRKEIKNLNKKDDE
jgi:hypothetical protein